MLFYKESLVKGILLDTKIENHYSLIQESLKQMGIIFELFRYSPDLTRACLSYFCYMR